MDSGVEQESHVEVRSGDRANLTAIKNAGIHQSFVHRLPQSHALLPQSSKATALRRTSDSVNGDVRAVDSLDHLGTARVFTPFPHKQNADSDADAKAGTGPHSKESSREAAVGSEDDKASFHSIQSSAVSKLRPRRSTGQFLFLDDNTSIEHLNAVEDVKRCPEAPLALGTSTMANTSAHASRHSHSSHPSTSCEVISPCASISSLTLNPLDTPLAVGPVFHDSSCVVDTLSTSPVQPPVRPPDAVNKSESLLITSKRTGLRRGVIIRARKLILRRRVLVLLFGHDRAEVVQSALNGVKRSSQVPNLDGSLGMMPPIPTGMIMSCVASQASSDSTPPFPSRRDSRMRRETQISSRNAERVKLGLDGNKIAGRRAEKPKYRRSLAEEVYLVQKGKRVRSTIGYPDDSLPARVEAWEKKNSWRYRLGLRRPRERIFDSIFGRGRSDLEAPWWRFWRTKSKDGKQRDEKQRSDTSQS